MLLNVTKIKRKEYIKNIENHLRNYNNYKIAIINLEKQLSLPALKKKSNLFNSNKEILCPTEIIKNELSELKILVESIEKGLTQLTEIEKKYIDYRYFKKWSISKTALKLSYSEKALFTIRNQAMDKLLISLGGLAFLKY